MLNSFLRTVSPIVAAIALVACATPAPPRELVEARESYKEASTGAALRVNPSGVDTARDRLVAAESAFKDDAKGQEAKDKAYLADRSAKLAIAQAQTKLAAEQQAEAQKQLGVVAQKNMTDLKKTQSELDLAKQAGAMTAEQLAAEKKALEAQKLSGAATQKQLEDAKLSAAATQKALDDAKLAAAANDADRARIQAELDAEKVKRADAEARAAKALANLAAMAAVKEEARGLVITLSGQVLFASGKATLLPAAQAALDNVAEALKANPDRNITVEGYTDSVGQRSFNDQLSQDRANAVRLYLVDRGIPTGIITARGYGPDKPVATNATAEGRANNRRVEIVVSPAERK